MLNLVPMARAGREVSDRHVEASDVGEVLQSSSQRRLFDALLPPLSVVIMVRVASGYTLLPIAFTTE